MIPSLHNGVSALKSVSDGLQVLGNNIANVGSLGFKSSRANYTDNFYMHVNKAQVGGQNTLKSAGTGVQLGSVSTNFNQGVLENTGLDLDLAIEGEALPNGGGFFEVLYEVYDPQTNELKESKTLYTRVGSFEESSDGTLVSKDAFRASLIGINGEKLNISTNDGEDLLARRVEQDGSINLIVSKNEQDEIVKKGNIRLVNFQKPQYLKNEGNGYFSEPTVNNVGLAGKIENVNPATDANGKIKQYALELSNVDLTNEFAMMITHQRSFQAGSRVVTTSDSILSEAVNLKR
jgi:flagellar hook protein FlgE